MIRAMRHFVSVECVFLFACAFLFFEGMVFYHEWRIGRRIVELPVRPGLIIIQIAAFFYGIFRSISFHPYFNRGYGEWLGRTPWTVDKPPPMGPIDLVWQDGVVLGVLILLLLIQPERRSITVMNVFLIAYASTSTLTFFRTGVPQVGYLASFCLASAVRALPWPWACFAITVPSYLLVRDGLWRSLARFPWDIEWGAPDSGVNSPLERRRGIGPSCGWPIDSFLRDTPVARASLPSNADSLMMGLILGWWLSCIQSLVLNPKWKWGLIGINIVTLLVVNLLLRIVYYGMNYTSPMNVLGRLATGSLVLPRFDVVYIAVALLALVGVLGLICCATRCVEPDFAALVFPAAIVIIGMACPPSPSCWYLTGGHRIVPNTAAQGPDPRYVKVG